MLRRAPTVIQLSTQDVLDYDDRRAAELAEAQARARAEEESLRHKENSKQVVGQASGSNGAGGVVVLSEEDKLKRVIKEREMRMGIKR